MRRRKPWWAVGVAVVVIGAVAVLAIVLSGNRQVLPFVPKRAPFTFKLGTTSTVSLRSKKGSPGDVPESVQTTLSAMYDGLFLDPHAWSTAPPSDVYDHFTDTAKPAAQQAGPSLGLGSLTGTISTLKVNSSNLAVRILIDPSGRPTSAIGEVQFVATAQTKAGSTIRITRHAQYLMENVNGTWLVAGFPKTATTLDRIVMSPAPPGGSGSQPQSGSGS
jgi:hypothetical protein